MYIEVIVGMRVLAKECKLVHGDLSEYNVLYHQDHCYIIDVSQSVEFDHPHAMSFLKRDCVNVTDFFSRMICCGPEGDPKTDNVCDETDSYEAWVPFDVQQLFEYVTCPDESFESTYYNERKFDSSCSSTSDTTASYVKFDSFCTKMSLYMREQEYQTVPEREPTVCEQSNAKEVDAGVFLNSWVPSSLHEISDYALLEAEMRRRKNGQKLLYDDFLKKPEVECVDEPTKDDSGDLVKDDSDSEGSSESSSVENEVAGCSKFDGNIPEGVEPKEWKRQVKQARKEKQKSKIPKHVKKKFRKRAANP